MEKRVVITFCGDYSPEEREEILENLRKKTKVEEKTAATALFQSLLPKKGEERQLFSSPKVKVGDRLRIRIFRDRNRMTGGFEPHYEVLKVEVKTIEPLYYLTYHAGLGEIFKVRPDQILEYVPKAQTV